MTSNRINMTDSDIEKKLANKGLDAPRLTPDIILGLIKREQYHLFEETQVTVCCLTLKNGYNVVAESACASPENFDTEIGRDLAYKGAVSKIWSLEGYLLKQAIFESSQIKQPPSDDQ